MTNETMIKTNTLKFLSPFVSSKTTSRNISAVSWSGRKETPARASVVVNSNTIAKASLVGVVAIGAMLALHLYWVNTYSDKGFALSEVQTSIKEQTELQKKLLVQQSLLNSTTGLTESAQNGLVTITDQEYLANNNFAAVE